MESTYHSKNMSYVFYTEYFENLDLNKKDNPLIKEKNKGIKEFQFTAESPAASWSELEGYKKIVLYTAYPGLLIGTGNEHSLAVNDALKCGFSFDYVTGLPYVPGSSVKGMLRAFFPGDGKTKEESAEYEEYIRGILDKPQLDVNLLKNDIFEGKDIFLGAFPVVENDEKLLDMEYITPHKMFKNPNPISMIKVKPNVKFEFGFVLSDFENQVTAEEKKKLFETIILDMGIGAKTNVGFGRFLKKALGKVDDRCPKTNSTSFEPNQEKSGISISVKAPKCNNRECSNIVDMRKDGSGWNKYCKKCRTEHYMKSRG